MTLYIASSWRNERYPLVLEALRAEGFACFDFRQAETGFRWTDIAGPKPWSAATLTKSLRHPTAERAFVADYRGMFDANACVLVLPCGKSAHLEAGWFTGRVRPLVVYMPEPDEPELMYLLAGNVQIVGAIAEIGAALRLLGVTP